MVEGAAPNRIGLKKTHLQAAPSDPKVPSVHACSDDQREAGSPSCRQLTSVLLMNNLKARIAENPKFKNVEICDVLRTIQYNTYICMHDMRPWCHPVGEPSVLPASSRVECNLTATAPSQPERVDILKTHHHHRVVKTRGAASHSRSQSIDRACDASSPTQRQVADGIAWPSRGCRSCLVSGKQARTRKKRSHILYPQRKVDVHGGPLCCRAMQRA